MMVLAPHPDQNGKGPELPQPVDGYPVVVLHGCHSVLPDGGNNDIVPTIAELAWDQAALDLCATDVRRIVICGKEDAHEDVPLASGYGWSEGHDAGSAAATVS